MTLTKFLRTGAAALGALAVASVTQANAADIYAGGMKEAPVYAPAPVWTGFYFGAHAGVDWSSLQFNNHTFYDDYLCGGCGGYNYYNFNGRTDNSTGGFIGGQLGYNWQWTPSWVLGIEVDLGAASVNHHLHDYGNMLDGHVLGVGFDTNNSDNMRFYGNVTGRVGYTWGTWMVYAKGGFAWLNVNNNMRETIYWNPGYSSGSSGNYYDSYGGNNNNDYVTGWTVGGGLEWKVSANWSLKAEYLHFEFNNNNNNCCNDYYASSGWTPPFGWNYNNNFNNNNNLTVDTVKIGFNYFWNPAPPAPLK